MRFSLPKHDYRSSLYIYIHTLTCQSGNVECCLGSNVNALQVLDKLGHGVGLSEWLVPKATADSNDDVAFSQTATSLLVQDLLDNDSFRGVSWINSTRECMPSSTLIVYLTYAHITGQPKEMRLISLLHYAKYKGDKVHEHVYRLQQ